MAYTADLKSAAARLTGSSPVSRTKDYAAFVLRIGHGSSKARMGVRFPHAAPVVGLLAHVG